MKSAAPFVLLVLCASGLAHASDIEAQAWPPRVSFAGGTELVATGNVAYDLNHFSGDDARLVDADDWRRREFGFTLRRRGVYDLGASFDFEARTWMDVALRVEGKALTGHDIGRFRIGQSKLPLGFEGNTATRNSLFVENALPTQAFYPGRRIGLDWSTERASHLLAAGYYRGDLQGNNPGRSLAARAAWTPFKTPGRVLHLGLAATREHPDGETDGRGIHVPPNVRWRARPEAGLTATRLVDSGTLAFVDSVGRAGVEALWIGGPWSVQGEFLRQRTRRQGFLPDYTGDGGYLAGSWIVTGQPRVYTGGNVANPLPDGRGALELVVRHSWIDLDAAGIAGGRQRNWTLGTNWYPTPHLKLQANYVFADARRGAVHTTPEIVALRAQAHF